MKILLSFLLLAQFPVFSQVAKDANERYRTGEGREAVARGLSAPDRNAKQRPHELVEAMKIRPGTTVADVGTGVGYMLPYLSKAVGASGRVIAEDIFDDFLAKAKDAAAKAELQNVTFVKGSETNPNLPAGGVDLILALDSYHHYDYPAKMLAGFHDALRESGRLVIVEYYRRPEAMPGGDALHHIRLDQPGVINEVEANQFDLLSKHDHVKGSQYMLIFERK
ncbi:MAG: class I SAM-dependent methyltransferase [Bryobacteraceae bacterium]